MRVGAACLDHGLRPESAAEVDRVRAFADQLAVPFFTKQLQLEDGPDLEARARDARYAALEELRRDHGFDLIATAHTADDQAETVLMRLGRGASLRGLSAIRARQGHVIRPVLFSRREDLRAYATARSLPFSDDPMNTDLRFLRVQVRSSLLPTWEALFPGGVRAAARFASQAVEDEALLEELAEAAFDRLLLSDGALDAAGVRSLAPAIQRRVLRRLMEAEAVRVDGQLIDEALVSLDASGQVTLPQGAFLRSASDAVRIVTRAQSEQPAEQPLPPGAWVAHHPSGLEIGLDVVGGTWDCAVASSQLRLTGAKPGDRMETGGAKLHDLLVDLKVARETRATVPVVRGEDGRVVCLPGLYKGASEGAHRVCVRLLPGRAAPRWVGRYRVGQ